MQKKSFQKGIIYAVLACILWGFIFIAPNLIPAFTPIDIVIGRYFFFGGASTLFFIKYAWRKKFSSYRDKLKAAMILSLFGTVGYYLFLVLGIRYSDSVISALIVSVSPITIAIYGNYHEKHLPYRKLFFPSLLILVGIALVNWQGFKDLELITNYSLGIFFTILSVLLWTWYVVKNSKFVKSETSLKPSIWATFIGVGSFVWALLFFFLASILKIPSFEMSSFLNINFFLVSAALGLLSSFLGAYFWNLASYHLPVSLAGQISILETVFGLLFFYLIESKIPTISDLLGIFILLSAVYFALTKFSKISRSVEESEPHL
jgi:drug/metabolite transporter (DMT)-like permease